MQEYAKRHWSSGFGPRLRELWQVNPHIVKGDERGTPPQTVSDVSQLKQKG